jgi:6,7-dimethyl-8-ribityllumazine synthase
MVAASKNVYRSREEFLMAGFAEKSGETIQATGAHLLVVAARFNAEIIDALRGGALAAIEAAGARATLIEVPGSLEIPAATVIALNAAEKAGAPYDGVVALGCIVRGDTYHFEIVSDVSARALMKISVSRALPLGNGILTVENETQAKIRADVRQGDKGGEAAQAALALVALKRGLA